MYENSGVYLITCIITNKIYVGSAINISKRWREHTSLLINNKHQRYFQNAWNKYGADAFEFTIFESGIPYEDLLSWEQAVLDFYESYLPEKGYNIAQFAGNSFGIKRSLESRVRMSEAHKGKKLTEKHRESLSKSRTGRVVSNKTRQRISEAQKGDKSYWFGKKQPQEMIEKRIEKTSGENHWTFGKEISPEHHQRLIDYNTNRIFTEQHRENLIKSVKRGEQNHLSKLNDNKVRGIKFLLEQNNLKQNQIAKLYGVSTNTISDIKKGLTWKHIII